MPVSLSRRALLTASAGAACALLPGRARAEQTIRVGYIPVLGSAPLFVLDGEGWARQAGLALQLVRFGAGPQAIQALASGKIDAYVAGVLPLLVARARGVDTKVVAAAAIEELEVVGRGKLAEGLQEGAADDLPARVAQFTRASGRKPKFAAQPSGSVPDTLLRYWLDQNKVDPATVEIVAIDIDATQQAFLAGSIDAAVLREPALTVVRMRVPGSRLLATGHQMMPGQPGSVLALYQPDRPETMAWKDTFVGLFIRATGLIREHPDQAAPFILQALGGGILTRQTMDQALASPGARFVSDPAVIVGPVKQLAEFQVKLGVLRETGDVDALFDLETYKRVHP